MKVLSKLFAAALLFSALWAQHTSAQTAVYQNEEAGITVELRGGTCKNTDVADALLEILGGVVKSSKGVHREVQGTSAKGPKDANVVRNGTRGKACWVLFEDKVILIDEFGNSGYIFYRDFVVKGI
jgi:cytochrome c-type biogenesis protein CcmH/NrfF